jgi:hypothetical protein
MPKIIDVSSEQDQLTAATNAVLDAVEYHRVYKEVPPDLVIRTSDPNVKKAGEGGFGPQIGTPIATLRSNMAYLLAIGVSVTFDQM